MPDVDEFLAQATRHIQNGQFAQARATCLAVLQSAPNQPAALHLLGLAILLAGDPEGALPYLERAARSTPADATYWIDLGNVLQDLGRPEEAAHAFKEALRLRPDYPQAFCNEGHCLLNRGHAKGAVSCFRQALRLNPGYFEAWNNLGIGLRQRENFQEALDCFERALQLQHDSLEAVMNLGLTYRKLGNSREAEARFRRALELRPDHGAAAAELAFVLGEQGRFREAARQWRETLRLVPDHGPAYFYLSQLALFAGRASDGDSKNPSLARPANAQSAHGAECFSEDDLARVKSLVAAGQGSTHDQSQYCFTLAAHCDRQGLHDEAFAYYRRANDLQKSLFEKAGNAFDASAHHAMIDWAIATFDKRFFHQAREWGVDSEAPIFIVGMPRSGSTLVAQILSGVPEVFGAGEIQEIPRLLEALAEETNFRPKDQPHPIRDQAAARKLAGAYLARMNALGQGAIRLVDKSLGNFVHLGLLAVLFPRAHFIHCRRDPRDMCLSCYFQNFDNVNFACSLEDIAVYFREYDRLMAHWRHVLPVKLFELQHEDLVRNQEAVTRDLAAYCGLPWDDRFLSFANNPRPVQTTSQFQIRQPMSAKALGRWQKYQAHIKPLLDALSR